MKITPLSLTVLLVNLASPVASLKCGKNSFEIAGSSTVKPVVQRWKEGYEEGCDDIEVTVRGGGSSNGARCVCGKDTCKKADGDDPDAKGEPVLVR